MARYEAGETLASIARTYDCSPPAISYVVSKSRARQPARGSAEAGPSGSEPQLIKAVASEAAEAGSRRYPRFDAPAVHGAGHGGHGGADRRAEVMSTGSDTAAAPAVQQLGDSRDHNGRDHRMPRATDGVRRDGFAEPDPRHPPAQTPGGTGNARPAPLGPAPVGAGTRAAAPRSEADARQRLHLSLGTGPTPHNGSSELVFPSVDRPSADSGVAADNRLAHAHAARPPYPAPNLAGSSGLSEGGPGPGQALRPNGNGAGSDPIPRKDGALSFIDHELRARVDNDIAAFLAAFDAALIEDTQENRFALREATDRLLRAGARTRIELERLEARVPLTAHARGGGDPGAWRYR